MRYRDFIERYFLIDEPKTGKLVSFVFRDIQNRYYDELVRDYDIERKGLSTPVREIILKARREGFSSLILGLFAADDILQENPTESLVISYRDDATETFRKRYRLFLTSYFANKTGYPLEQIQQNPLVLDAMAKQYFEQDSTDIVLKHNKAHFYCGTASARVGGRGGVLQKLLFSESAFYPDTEKMTAKEIVDGTMRQVDIDSGWVFVESTANGYGNYYQKMWDAAKTGQIRFKPRFYGWQEFYTPEQFTVIQAEYTDKLSLRADYPSTPEEAFIMSGSPYFDAEKIFEYLQRTQHPKSQGEISLINGQPKYEEMSNGELLIWETPKKGTSYVIGGDTAEGLIDGDWSVAKVIDNRTLKTVASLRTHTSPDKFEKMVFALGLWYNEAYLAVESNKDGLWANTELFNDRYPNLYYREEIDDITRAVKRKVGWLTTEKTRPVILSELRKTLNTFTDCWNDKGFLEECLTFVRGDNGRPDAMSGKHDDQIIALAIALEVRRNAPESLAVKDTTLTQAQENIIKRLEAKYGKRGGSFVSQRDFI